jgi:hypothetical protein
MIARYTVAGRRASRLGPLLFPTLLLVTALGLLSGCTSFQDHYARLLQTLRGGEQSGLTGQAAGDSTPEDNTTAASSPAGSGGTPINKPAATAPTSQTQPASGSTPINTPVAAAASQPSSGTTPGTTPAAATPATQSEPTSGSSPSNAAAATASTQPGQDMAEATGAMAQTPGADKTLRVGLNIQHLDIGMPLPVFGKNLAVVPARDGHKCVGLNGVSASQASFKGKQFKNFKIDAKMDFNFPLSEGSTFKTQLLSLRLGTSAERTFDVTISQGEAEPPMAVFSVSGPKLAPDMFCSQKPLRWKEDQPDATTSLLITKEAGSIRFEYDGEMVCTSPLDPNLTLTGFSTPINGNTHIYDMALIKLPDAAEPGVPAAGAKASTGLTINGRGATEEAQEQPFPAAEIAKANGVTHFDLKKLSAGSPVGGLGKNLLVLDDEEGKYVTSPSPEGSYVLLPAETGKDFSVSILIKNAFVLSDRTDRTDHFFLFRINYKNGVKELYTTDITRPSNTLWRSRYYISRSGPDLMDWTTSTDYRPWNNALDFNEYKVIKEKDLIRFFFNGEFIRSEKTMGDVLQTVKVDLREHERLYDIVVRDVAVTGPEQKGGPWVKEHTLDESGDRNEKAAQPAKGETP